MTYAPKNWTLGDPHTLDLWQVVEVLRKHDPERMVPLGFGRPHSYRMDYSELAFEPMQCVTIGSMLEAAESSVGQIFEGWKGGDYRMETNTSVWIAFKGDPGEPLGALFLSVMLAELTGNSNDEIDPQSGRYPDGMLAKP